MSLQVTSLNNATTAKDEYVELHATADVELSSYAILDQTYKNGKLSNLYKHFFHLPKLKLKKGEYVKVFTGKGDSKTMYKKGTAIPIYYVYWGSESPVWNNNEKDKLELIKFEYVLVKTV